MDELSEEERAIVELVRDFVDRDVRPVVREPRARQHLPGKLIEQMKQLGIFGLAIPEPWGDAQVSTPATRCHRGAGPRVDEPGRGHGRPHGGGQAAPGLRDATSRRTRYLPRMATGELRATMALTEPGGGSDLQAMRTSRAATADRRISSTSSTGPRPGSPTPAAPGCRAAVQDRSRRPSPRTRGISILLAEPGPASRSPATCPSSATRGSRAASSPSTTSGCPATRCSASEEGEGFAQMMRGLEIGRIQVAARARSASARPRWRTRCGTRSSGRRSASRSGSTSRSATTWPTWRPS